MNFSHRSAILGGLAWAILSAGAATGLLRLGVIEILFLLAPLVIVPLALPLAAGDKAGVLLRIVSRLQPVAAGITVASFLLPTGRLAGALALPWFLVTGLVAFAGLARLRTAWRDGLADLLVVAAMLFLPVGGFWLAGSRAGFAVGGFPEPIVLLTAVHFHYTAFAAPLLIAIAGHRATGFSRALFLLAGPGTVISTPLLAVGFVVSPALKVAAALALSVSVSLAAAVQIGVLMSLRGRAARGLLGISSLAVLAGMALAALYAVGEFTRDVWIAIPAMARTHGPLNGVGFALLGLIAWTLEGRPNSR